MTLSAPEPPSERASHSPSPGFRSIPHPPSFLFGEEGVHQDVEPARQADADGNAPNSRKEAAPPRTRRRTLITAAVGLAIVLVAWVAVPRLGARRPAPDAGARTGTLVVESQSAGWHVWEGDVDLGATPLTVALPAGRRTLVLRRGTTTRELPVEVASGARTVYRLDLPGLPASGDLHVDTKPSGAIVAVDGFGRGVTPLDVHDLKAGRHVVTVLVGDRVLSETVTIEAGRAASLMVPLDQAGAPAVGWVVVQSPVELEVREGESLVGSSRNPRLLFMPGRHVLRLSNKELNFEMTRTVQVQPGATASVSVRLPQGSLSVNASPWAEVWLDGAKVGETPMANYPAALGRHEIILRHPKLGEQRRTVVVSLGEPMRVGVDLRQ
jgi:hypothetical protein